MSCKAWLWVGYIYLYIEIFLFNTKCIPLDDDFVGDFYFYFLVFACSWPWIIPLTRKNILLFKAIGDNCLCVIAVECSHSWDSVLFKMKLGSSLTYYIQSVLKGNTSDSISRRVSYTLFMARTGKRVGLSIVSKSATLIL